MSTHQHADAVRPHLRGDRRFVSRLHRPPVPLRGRPEER
jgi:hypothetical protein